MRKSQELTIKLSEGRQRLNAAIEKRNKLPADKEPDGELVAEMDAATKAIGPLEIEYRAAVTAEAAEDEANSKLTPDAEHRERDKLLAGASVLPFLLEGATGKLVEGREAEARAAIFGDHDRPGLVPFDMLLPRGEARQEHRADAVSPVADSAKSPGSQASVLERVFTRSIAARLLVAMPVVSVGQATYPVMTAGTTAAQVAADAGHDAGAAAFTGHSLEPVRLSARYIFRIEDVYRMRGLEDVLRRDLSAVMADEMDAQIVNGDGVAPNVNGFMSELAAPDADDAAADWSGYLAKFTSLVDGVNAFSLSDIRTIIGKDSFAYAEGLFRTGATDNGPRASAGDYVRNKIGGYSVSSRVKAQANNADGQINIAALTSYPGRNAVAPIWRGFEVIRDNVTKAKEGQIVLTALMLWNFKIVRETGFHLLRVRKA